MGVRVRIEIGDWFRIPLSDGRWAYCQHIAYNSSFGYLMLVMDRFTFEPLNDPANLIGGVPLFPPVFVGLRATARSGRWPKIGNTPVKGFIFPKFRQAMGTKPGTYDSWWIWDGKKEKKIGKLPEHLRSLELRCVWGDEALEERIVAGTYRGDRMF